MLIRKSVTLCLLLLSLTITGYSQDAATRWLNENAHLLKPDTTATTEDLAFLSTALKDNTVFGLGEASHGTREFYNQKRRIIAHLITHLDYKRLGFEFQDTYMEPVNAWLQGGQGDLKELMKDMVLYNTVEIYQLFRFIRQYNDTQPAAEKVTVYGLDREAYAGDPFNRDRFMAENAIAEQSASQEKTILWAHNIHIAKDTTMAQFPAMGYHLRKKYGDRFYVLGFDTYNGSVSVLTQEEGLVARDFSSQDGSFSAIFAKAAHPVIYVPFDIKPNPFSGVRNNITNIYANWTERRALPIVPGVDFDAILFIRNTTASVPLD